MRVLIVEDELPSVRKLERLLSNFEIEVVGNLQSVKKTIEWLKNNEQPDLIFLDVHLSDGLCFEIFNHIQVISKIIFTTAFSDYSIKAFDYNSISYLLKPIKEEDLKKAIDKVSVLKQKEDDLLALKKLFKEYETNIYKTSFTVKNGKKIKIIKEEEVVCFFSEDNITFIQTANFKGILNNSLSYLENELNPKKFFRVNRAFIINIKQIKDIEKYNKTRLKLILNSYENQEIIVSRERVKDFKNWID